ncbi:MAG TPA: hypothetical protein VGR54_08790 [Nitrosopumilaceae archaeon]|nr:hypothetical protein [Nitrosopumilaceae archaeon]
MNLKLLFIIVPILLLASFIVIHENFAFGQTNSSTTYNVPQEQSNSDVLIINSNTKEAGQNSETVKLPISELLFDVTPNYDKQGKTVSLSIKLKPGLDDIYQAISLFNKPRDIVFIYPSFTQAAYSNKGFYDYYHKICDTSCLTVPIPTKVVGFQSSSIAGALVLKLLNYPYVKDEDVDKNPDILKQYKRVIVLHNEYVTKKEFDAITSHPDVVFLYPNALYAKVSANYDSNTITLVRGHDYPAGVRNGFDWKYDNSKYEYDIECNNWNFYSKEITPQYNHVFLNCYPEYRLLYSHEILLLLQKPDPTDLVNDLADWLRYPNQVTSTRVLGNYDISGTYIPQWIAKPANWLLNGDISEYEFDNIITYLSQQNIIR